MPTGAKQLKKRAQNKRNAKGSCASRRRDLEKQRRNYYARKQGKSLEAIDGPPREKVSLREKHGVII